jgi:hypothetical protein
MFSETENIFSRFNFDTVGGILMHWLLPYIVFCEPNELQNTSNAGTRFYPHALLLQPKRNNFISDSIQGRSGYLLVCAVASQSSPPAHVCICDSHSGSELPCLRVYKPNFWQEFTLQNWGAAFHGILRPFYCWPRDAGFVCCETPSRDH